jgi:hypothetical protein
MAASMKGIGETTKQMVEEDSYMLTVMYTKEIGLKIKQMDLVFILI